MSFLRRRVGRPRIATTAPPDDGRRDTASRTLAFDDVVDISYAFGPDDIVVSCGADWSGKDLDAIRAAKERDRFRYVSVCYDVIPWRFPEFWPPRVAQGIVAYYADLALVADVVACISNRTADDYAALCEEYGAIPPALPIFRLGDIRSGAATDASLPDALAGGRFLLSVGSLEPRKNHRLLYEVWDALVREPTFPPDLTLVFVSSARWMTDDLMDDIASNPAVRDRILAIDKASDGELDALYSACLFTLYPSLYEGWGLPVAESLSRGKACLASDRASIPEISDLVVLIDPDDADAWRDAIRLHVGDAEMRQALEERIRRTFVPTSWSESARRFFEIALTDASPTARGARSAPTPPVGAARPSEDEATDTDS